MRTKIAEAKLTQKQIVDAISQDVGVNAHYVNEMFYSLKSIIQSHIAKGAVGSITLPVIGVKISSIRKKATQACEKNIFGKMVQVVAKPARVVVKTYALKSLKELV